MFGQLAVWPRWLMFVLFGRKAVKKKEFFLLFSA
jgi:hypothetical protein